MNVGSSVRSFIVIKYFSKIRNYDFIFLYKSKEAILKAAPHSRNLRMLIIINKFVLYKKLVMKILLFTLLLFMLCSCSKIPGDSALIQVSKTIISNQQVSPGTAKFPDDNEIKIIKEKGDTTFYISSYVDAKNELGEMKRNEWTLHLWYKGGEFLNPGNYKVLSD